MVWLLQKSLAVPQKHTELPDVHSQVCTYTKELKTDTQTLAHRCFSITFHNNPKVEAIQMPMNG